MRRRASDFCTLCDFKKRRRVVINCAVIRNIVSYSPVKLIGKVDNFLHWATIQILSLGAIEHHLAWPKLDLLTEI